MYLRIMNPGVAPSEGFTIFGVSTSRYSDQSQTIGKFGTGAKHSVNLLLRNNINPIIFCGRLKLEFYTRPLSVNDGISSCDFSRVCVKYSGQDETGKSKSSTEDLSVTLESGVFDWTSCDMALREFVSNALDRSHRQLGNFSGARIEIVDKPRAKSDHTCVFVPLTLEVQKFYNELHKRFLHFREEPNLGKKLLPKANRNISPKNSTMVYKKGVFVREYSENELPSIFDYNLGEELTMDESRHCDDYSIKAAVGKAVANAKCGELAPILKAIVAGEKVFETTLDSYRLKDTYATETVRKSQEKEWQAAWEAVAGPNGVATTKSPHIGEYVKKKGFSPQVIESEGWYAALESHGIRTDAKVLTDVEKKGSTVSPATLDMIAAVNKIWNLLTVYEATNGKQKPEVMAFTEVMDGESQRLGYYSFSDKKVYLHTDLGVGQSPMLLQTALEEVVHHVTGSGDMSRDLQDFLFRLLAKMGL